MGERRWRRGMEIGRDGKLGEDRNTERKGG